MYLSESLQKKWGGVLDHPDLPKIEDPYKKAVTAVILENQAVEMGKSAQTLQETSPTNFADTGGFGTAGNQTTGTKSYRKAFQALGNTDYYDINMLSGLIS